MCCRVTGSRERHHTHLLYDGDDCSDSVVLIPLYYAFAKLNLIGNIPATSLILSAMFMPLSVFLMRTFFLNVPKELEDAARIDGANTGQVIWHVMRPVVSPGLITVGILIGLQSWNEYLVSSTFLQGGKRTLPLL